MSDTAADYKLRNPGIRQGDICPECDEAVPHDNGVCFYCVCGCDICEGLEPPATVTTIFGRNT